jgi:pimeloyl-ACP methyl ester carboxylesterase
MTDSGASMSRRVFMAAGAACVVAASAWNSQSSAESVNKVTFVLVHPAWLGGWCWKKVTPLLRDRGNRVFTPTLTGLGERAHLADPKVSLVTHIEDVVNMLEFEDLRLVVLVGNSSGGMVITGVADRVPERLAQLMYLDAFVPEANQSLLDLLPADRRQAIRLLLQL